MSFGWRKALREMFGLKSPDDARSEQSQPKLFADGTWAPRVFTRVWRSSNGNTTLILNFDEDPNRDGWNWGRPWTRLTEIAPGMFRGDDR